MFLAPDDADEPLEGIEEMPACKSLQNLGESIQSLLGSKRDLTFSWADAVRLMIEDLPAPDSGSPRSFCSPSSNNGDIKVSEEEKQQLEEDIAKLEDELVALKTYIRLSVTKRREALNKLLDLKGSIRVFCRLRPFLVNEKGANPGPIVDTKRDKIDIGGGGKSKAYYFDKVFLPEASQEDVFAEVEPILRSALDGHNVCIFAYGQTGTGKTFTMEGRPESPGVVPHTIQELFRQAALNSTVNFTFTFSMLEVYMGYLRDLLARRPTRLTDPPPKCLSIQMDANGSVEVENLREVVVTDFSEARRWYQVGSRARSTAWTNANEASSRSHCLIRISISCSGDEDRSINTSKLWMIDLGGSERLLKTQATGLTMEEGKAINLSLSALGDVISALQRKQSHVPYRNSKLTQILRDSLGDNSKTLMIVHISPKEDDLPETICSLSFATRARGIHLGRELSSEVKEQRAVVMADLIEHIRHVEDECQGARNNLQTIEFLLREKKKLLAKCDPESKNQETQEISGSQEESVTDTQTIDLCSVNADRYVGSLPRFMNPTACSRLRGRQDSNCRPPGIERRDRQEHGRRKSLPTYVRTMPNCSRQSATVEQSQCDSEWNKPKYGLPRSSMSSNKTVAGLVSKQCRIDESQCHSEWNTTVKDSGYRRSSMPNNRRVSAGSLSKQLCTTDESQCPSEYNANTGLRRSSLPNNRRISGSFPQKYITDETKWLLNTMPKDNGSRRSSMPNSKRVSGSLPKQFTTDEISECVTENCNQILKESEPRCSAQVPNRKKQTSFRETVSNKHIRIAGNGHNPKQSSSKSSVPSALSKTIRKGDESKHGEAMDIVVGKTETQKKAPPGDFQARTTSNSKQHLPFECRISFSRKP